MPINMNSKYKKLAVFLVSVTLVFLMNLLPRAGVKTHLINPIPPADAFDKVLPKLQQKSSSYRLQQTSDLISTAYASGDYNGASAYTLVDFDSGSVLMSKSSDQRLPIASLTKLMSAVVALDLVSPDELLSVSDKAANETPTRLALNVGDKLRLDEALKAALLTSANDCAEVIAEGIDQKYGQGMFIRAMNEKAREIGMKETYFTNPQGFDDGNPYSSASDLAVLVHYALTNYPLIAQIVSMDHAELIPSSTHQKYEYLNNWNGLMGVYPGIEGVKIGNTDQAGYTTMVVSQRSGKKLIAVMLGTPGVIQRDLWTAELLDEGFSQFGIDKANIVEADLKARYSTWKYFN